MDVRANLNLILGVGNEGLCLGVNSNTPPLLNFFGWLQDNLSVVLWTSRIPMLLHDSELAWKVIDARFDRVHEQRHAVSATGLPPTTTTPPPRCEGVNTTQTQRA